MKRCWFGNVSWLLFFGCVVICILAEAIVADPPPSAIERRARAGLLSQEKLIPEPHFKVSPLDFLILSMPRSLSNYFVASLGALGFRTGSEYLASQLDFSYNAAVYYFRYLRQNRWPKSYPLSFSEAAKGLNAILSNGFPNKRDPSREFSGFKIFPYHFDLHSFTSFLKESAIIGNYPLKVIHLVRHDFILRALSSLESRANRALIISTSENIPQGSVLSFNSETIHRLNEEVMRGCVWNSFYRSDLIFGQRSGLVQVLEVDSEDIQASSPNFERTFTAIRQFLLTDVDITKLKAVDYFRLTKPILDILQPGQISHVRGRSRLSLQERVPDLRQVIVELMQDLPAQTGSKLLDPILYDPDLVSSCKLEIIAEYKLLLDPFPVDARD